MNAVVRSACALALATALSAAAADRIVVGQSAPLTGANAEIGKDIRDGAAAYFRKVNESGGVNGICAAATKSLCRRSRVTSRCASVPVPHANKPLMK